MVFYRVLFNFSLLHGSSQSQWICSSTLVNLQKHFVKSFWACKLVSPLSVLLIWETCVLSSALLLFYIFPCSYVFPMLHSILYVEWEYYPFLRDFSVKSHCVVSMQVSFISGCFTIFEDFQLMLRSHCYVFVQKRRSQPLFLWNRSHYSAKNPTETEIYKCALQSGHLHKRKYEKTQ